MYDYTYSYNNSTNTTLIAEPINILTYEDDSMVSARITTIILGILAFSLGKKIYFSLEIFLLWLF